MNTLSSDILARIIVLGLCLAINFPCVAIEMKGEGRKLSEEELNSRTIVREGKALEVMEVKDLDSPLVFHDPVREAKRGKALTICATIRDESEVQSATLYFRTIGQGIFDTIKMKLGGEDLYRAVIPDYICIGEGVEYYIRAVDSSGNSPGYSGSEDEPHRATFTSGSHQTSTTIAFLLLITGIVVIVIAPKYIHRSESVT